MVRKAFTLIELLVVIVVIILLAGLLIPVISMVRQSAYLAKSQQSISNLRSAIENYHQTFSAYPGPLTNLQVYQPAPPGPAPQAQPFIPPGSPLANVPTMAQITMSENLVLGLLGGLRYDPTLPVANRFQYDAAYVGKGPRNLNPAQQASAQSHAFLEVKPGDLSGGHYADSEGSANDTIIPEFLDAFPNGMPILYLRARVGANPPAPYNLVNNPVITNDPNGLRVGQYDLSQIIGYTGSSIGVGKAEDLKRRYTPPMVYPAHGLSTLAYPPAATPTYPYDAYVYMRDPSIPNSARQKDGYILISAGKDRIYGTEDDITSFGSVAP
jgi:type II secretory pathway pseudopilin PulG